MSSGLKEAAHIRWAFCYFLVDEQKLPSFRCSKQTAPDAGFAAVAQINVYVLLGVNLKRKSNDRRAGGLGWGN